ncbi:fused MFS/spermidine synthase [methane-oxidizing endosymbiont of Gigantopelta aegis]|uniref:fused MFS/spermidine synthase n=1 Tax=methane-oxidizing endosymbiont of Gigantopelta aegis TaxID=2794938 RepID=UPI0018DB76E2|nr:fused MFS/spermidine synthase [methane-oxidizing endosymbiont of Gigantopelta aegis]
MNTVQSPEDKSYARMILFAGTLFISATLMFVVQPMFGKLLLPLLGGTPAVWNTCMVFYQMVLFLGYLYAHFLSGRLETRRQIQIHLAIIVLSLIALPVALPEGITPPTESNPTFWLVAVLFIAIGLPFFVVSTTAPLLQKWFSRVGHHTSDDPYYLYAASNAGSLLALLSYPFIIEPNIGLAQQQFIWSLGYALLILLIAFCAWALWRSQTADASFESATDDAPTLNYQTRLYWLALAFVPSSLLLGLTNFISTDIASVPLLWIIPLTLYLLSFVLVFSNWAPRIHPFMLAAQPVILLPFIAFSFINPAVLPYWLNLLLHLLAFFMAIMVCHGELAKNRPHTRHLTDFYLIMSFAGMLGGMFNTFVAPFVFDGVYEYPIMIVAALMLRPGFFGQHWRGQLWLPALILIAGFVVYFSTDQLPAYLDSIGVVLILLAGVTYAFRQQPLSLALLTGLILFFSHGLHSLLSNTLYQERSFFGVFSVREAVMLDEQQRPEKYHELFHGTTKHGAQRLKPPYVTTPYTYYSKPGPMGQLFKVYDSQDAHWSIASVGLGAGALACYAKPTQNWRFYEIDPLVIKIAKTPKYFSYLSQCAPSAPIIVGDARLSLQHEPDQQFDLLILDAFSSDSVPTHLLTQEAMDLYFAKLKADGILAFHITNRHLALKKVLADHAQKLKLAALIQEFKPPADAISLIVATDWVVMSKDARRLEALQQSRLGKWQKLPLYFDMKSWTDDFTNIVEIWK